MLYLSKKGMHFNVVTGLLMLLAAFVVIVLLQRELYAEVSDKLVDAKCLASVKAAAASKLRFSVSGIGRPSVKLDCPRGNLTIKKKDIVEGDSINQDKAHQIIADAMLGCWRKIGAGEVDPFSNWDNKKVSYCLICDSIAFDKPLEEFVKNAKDDNERVEKRSIKGLTQFLITRPPKAGEKSYYELLFGSEPYGKYLQELERLENEKGQSIILPGSAIIVQMHKLEAKSSGVTNFVYIVGGAALVVGTVVTGGVLLVGTAAALGFGTLTVGTIVLGVASAGLIPVTSYLLVANTVDAFSRCKDCNAVGGIAIVPSELSFSDLIEIKPKNEKPYQAKLCDVMIN